MKKRNVALFVLLLAATAAFNGCWVHISRDRADEEKVESLLSVKLAEPCAKEPCVEHLDKANIAAKAQNPMPDGGYHVAFDPAEIRCEGDKYFIEFEFFNYDMYNPSDIDSLKVGSHIIIAQKCVVVEMLSRDKGFVKINGEIEEGGYILTQCEDGLYRTMIFNDFPLYYSIGRVRLELAENFVFTDSSDLDKPKVISDANGLMKSRDNGFFSQYNTSINIEGNKVVRMNRNWIP